MTASHDLERRVADYYASEAPPRAPDRVLGAILETIEATPQRRVLVRGPWRILFQDPRVKVAVVALAAIASGIVGLAIVGNSAPQPAPEPLTWTPERYAQDWPAPPRSESAAAGDPDVTPVRGDETHWEPSVRAWKGLEFNDAAGDVAPESAPWIDIRRVLVSPGSFSLELGGGVPLMTVDPADRWTAYGLVFDTNADGMPDERVGVDNMPDGQHRAWWADLATGQTKWKAGAPYGSVYDNGVSGGVLGLDTWYPSASEESEGVTLRYSAIPVRYYAWASMIEDGRVVATDYAPDVGWLVEPDDPGLPLVGSTWIIEREIPSRSLTVVMWLIFTADGQLQLELCQRGEATVQVTQDTMRVTDIALTGDACSAEVTEMEAEILAVLSAGEISYTLDAGILELRADPNAIQLTGSPDPPPGF
jgi:hypothetical protein